MADCAWCEPAIAHRSAKPRNFVGGAGDWLLPPSLCWLTPWWYYVVFKHSIQRVKGNDLFLKCSVFRSRGGSQLPIMGNTLRPSSLAWQPRRRAYLYRVRYRQGVRIDQSIISMRVKTIMRGVARAHCRHAWVLPVDRQSEMCLTSELV